MDKEYLVKLLAITSNFIWEALVAILIGFFVGRWLDSLFDLNHLFMIVLMVVGALAVIRNFIMRVLRLGEKYDKQ